MGYSADVEIPGDSTDPGYTMTNGYSGEYVVSDRVHVTHSYDSDVPSGSTLSHGVLTYPDHYTPAAPLMTTVPYTYCSPLVANQYMMQQHPHNVCFTSLVCLISCRDGHVLTLSDTGYGHCLSFM